MRQIKLFQGLADRILRHAKAHGTFRLIIIGPLADIMREAVKIDLAGTAITAGFRLRLMDPPHDGGNADRKPIRCLLKRQTLPIPDRQNMTTKICAIRYAINIIILKWFGYSVKNLSHLWMYMDPA